MCFNCDQGKVFQDPRPKCPKCGLPNKCGIADGKRYCWCFGYPKIDIVIGDGDECLCESCLKKILEVG